MIDYAKLMRKRDKAGAGSEGGKPITIESLRASTASARGGEHGEPPSQGPSPHHHMPPPPPPHPPQLIEEASTANLNRMLTNRGMGYAASHSWSREHATMGRGT